MTATCEILWVDANGPTPDENPSIGRVRCKGRTEQHHGRAITFEASPWYHICAKHAERMNEPGMHHWEWENPVTLAKNEGGPMTTHVANCALEWWRASGERTEARLLRLVEHYARANGEIENLSHHTRVALSAVKPWEYPSCAK